MVEATDKMFLDVDRMLEEAVTDTGLDDFGDDEFRPALACLMASLSTQADLHAHGRTAVHSAILQELCNRLYATAARSRHGAIAEIEIARPVFVVGLLRTGTTLLHNLLSLHPQLYAPALWELSFPVSERPNLVADRSLEVAAQGYVDAYYRVAPALARIHYLQADRPDECHRLTGNAFLSKVYEMRFRVPDYGRWLAERSIVPGYRHHRRLLQHIVWRNPHERLVLKCPFHFWNLPDLLTVYPDAQVILLHRDVRKVVPSASSLCRAIREPRSEALDLPDIGAWVLRDFEAGVRRIMDWHESASKRIVLDIRYQDLVSDPLATLATIQDFVGLPQSDHYRASVRQWREQNHKHSRGRHQYHAREFGLDIDHIAERFADYHKHFDIPAEGV